MSTNVFDGQGVQPLDPDATNRVEKRAGEGKVESVKGGDTDVDDAQRMGKVEKDEK